MGDPFCDRLATATAHAVLTRSIPSLDAWIIVVLDDVRLGSAVGGTRIKVYPDRSAGLADALRLGAGMTRKWAALGLRRGGGKAVLSLARELGGDERRELLEIYGTIVESLRGSFGTGPDLGATLEDMRTIASRTRYVHGIHPDGSIEDAGPYTARGVRVSIEAALEARTGLPDLAGKKIWVEGVGDVGAPLARELAARGAQLFLSDLDIARLKNLASELDARVIGPGEGFDLECDVYSPCAVGATLSAETIPRLRASIVAGSANNQLAVETDAELLHSRGILYAPDYITNGGGALALALFGDGEQERETLLDRVASIGARLRTIFSESRERDESPMRAAERLVEQRLLQG